MDIIYKKKKELYFKFLNNLPQKINSNFFKKFKGSYEINNKSKKKNLFDPVTSIDKNLELFLRRLIKKKFPNDGIRGEEFKEVKTKTGFTWIIDPIDGTRSFVIGSPTWSNLISLDHNGTPLLGLANFPVLNKYYITGPNHKSYLVQKKNKKILKSLNNKSFSKIKVAAGLYGFSLKKQMKVSKFIDLVEYPCCDALSYCQVAEGKLDVVAQSSNKIWDIHPLISIIESAGGVVTTWKNKNASKGGNILASANKTIHNKILKLLKSEFK